MFTTLTNFAEGLHFGAFMYTDFVVDIQKLTLGRHVVDGICVPTVAIRGLSSQVSTR